MRPVYHYNNWSLFFYRNIDWVDILKYIYILIVHKGQRAFLFPHIIFLKKFLKSVDLYDGACIILESCWLK